MIPVPDKALKYLADAFSFDCNNMKKFGGGREDSDGVIYSHGKGKSRHVLKIISKNLNDAFAYSHTLERARFFEYLGKNSIPVVAPKPNKTGNLVEQVVEGENLFLAYSYRRLLLFTVMQDWLKTQPKTYNSWKQMVIEQPPVFELVKRIRY